MIYKHAFIREFGQTCKVFIWLQKSKKFANMNFARKSIFVGVSRAKL